MDSTYDQIFEFSRRRGAEEGERFANAWARGYNIGFNQVVKRKFTCVSTENCIDIAHDTNTEDVAGPPQLANTQDDIDIETQANTQDVAGPPQFANTQDDIDIEMQDDIDIETQANTEDVAGPPQFANTQDDIDIETQANTEDVAGPPQFANPQGNINTDNNENNENGNNTDQSENSGGGETIIDKFEKIRIFSKNWDQLEKIKQRNAKLLYEEENGFVKVVDIFYVKEEKRIKIEDWTDTTHHVECMIGPDDSKMKKNAILGRVLKTLHNIFDENRCGQKDVWFEEPIYKYFAKKNGGDKRRMMMKAAFAKLNIDHFNHYTDFAEETATHVNKKQKCRRLESAI